MIICFVSSSNFSLWAHCDQLAYDVLQYSALFVDLVNLVYKL